MMGHAVELLVCFEFVKELRTVVTLSDFVISVVHSGNVQYIAQIHISKL